MSEQEQTDLLHEIMSAIKPNLKKWSAVVGVLIAVVTIVCSAGATWATTGITIANHEARIKKLETDHEIDHDLLTKAVEDIGWVRRKIELAR